MEILEQIKKWSNQKMKGYITVGPVTVYGINAMHIAVNVQTKRWGFVCFHPSLRFLGKYAPWMLGENFPWYFYLSPNAAPWASTFAIGPGIDLDTKIDALRRYTAFGHGFDVDAVDVQAESAVFWKYLDRLRNTKKKFEGEDEDHECEGCGMCKKCGMCGGDLDEDEQQYSNVCLECLLKECNRIASRITQKKSGGGVSKGAN